MESALHVRQGFSKLARNIAAHYAIDHKKSIRVFGVELEKGGFAHQDIIIAKPPRHLAAQEST